MDFPHRQYWPVTRFRNHLNAVVLDLRSENIDLARSMGLTAEMGDAMNPDVLRHHGLLEARAIVITLPDHRASVHIVQASRQLSPNIAIVVRARYHPFVSELEEGGADIVVDEEYYTASSRFFEQSVFHAGRHWPPIFRKPDDFGYI